MAGTGSQPHCENACQSQNETFRVEKWDERECLKTCPMLFGNEV